MFGLGMMEILMILAIALIVVGPQKLPELAKTLGRAMGEFKRSAQDLKRSIDIETTVGDVPKTDLKDILKDKTQDKKDRSEPGDEDQQDRSEPGNETSEASKDNTQDTPENSDPEDTAPDNLNPDEAAGPESSDKNKTQ